MRKSYTQLYFCIYVSDDLKPPTISLDPDLEFKKIKSFKLGPSLQGKEPVTAREGSIMVKLGSPWQIYCYERSKAKAILPREVYSPWIEIGQSSSEKEIMKTVLTLVRCV